MAAAAVKHMQCGVDAHDACATLDAIVAANWAKREVTHKNPIFICRNACRNETPTLVWQTGDCNGHAGTLRDAGYGVNAGGILW